jgi:hypothetical protein
MSSPVPKGGEISPMHGARLFGFNHAGDSFFRLANERGENNRTIRRGEKNQPPCGSDPFTALCKYSGLTRSRSGVMSPKMFRFCRVRLLRTCRTAHCDWPSMAFGHVTGMWAEVFAAELGVSRAVRIKVVLKKQGWFAFVPKAWFKTDSIVDFAVHS